MTMAQRFLSVREVAMQLHVAESTAYAIIRRWNKELEEMGYFVKAGSIPEAYFAKKSYGYTNEQ